MEGEKQNGNHLLVLYALLFATLAILITNQFAVASVNASMNSANVPGKITDAPILMGANEMIDVAPKGVPEIYGQDLGVR